MGLFRRRSPESSAAPVASLAPFSELIASDGGDGLQFSLLDRATGAMSPLPPIEVLLRSTEDLDAIIATLRLAGQTAADLPIIEQVAPGVATTLVLDEGDRFSTLTESALARMRLTPPLARSGAWARLRQACSGLRIDGSDGRYRLTFPANPDMAASFALVTDTWLNKDALRGTPVMAVGNRTALHVCGSADEEGISALRDIAEASYRQSVSAPAEHGQPITPRLLTTVGGALVDFDSV
ncbi:hypothetical protein RS83_01062 [Microbacterium oxydans]|uniref:SseB protein N-terminal domain-containing protein n=2 Tax=Microbacterium oxydans TaxID=82380 RepID=A0A0F0LAT5_9MICO|nr:hypothetical protein RS83_01062 [Microbacterium oxydans]